MNRHPIRRAGAAITAGASIALAASATQPQPDPLSPPANGPRKADPAWHAFTNATVHPRPGVTLEHATVVIKGDRIVSIEAAPAPKSDGTATASPPAPAGARAWDCAGLHIYAGLIDPYVEVDVPAPGPDSPGAHWNTRVTPQRTALDAGGIDPPTAESLRKLGYAAAAISPRAGIFRGTAAVVSLAKPDEDLSLARPPVYAENTYQSVALDAGRMGGRRGGGAPPAVETNTNSNWPGYPDSQMGAIALIRQTLIDADWQAGMRALDPRVHSALDSLRSDLARNAPFGVLAASSGNNNGAQRLPLLFNTDDELEYARASKIAREFDRPLFILGCGTEFRRLAAIEDDKLPIILPLNFPEPPKVASIGQAESVELRDLMTWEQAPTNPRRLEQAGLQVSLTTSKLRDRAKFRDNLRKAILHGLTEDQALGMVTTRPAELLAVNDKLGTIEPGKVASLVIADGPLFAKKTVLRDLWVDGKRYELNAPPPLKLQGEWEVSITPPPKPPEGSGPAPVVQIFFSIDKDNNITISKRTTSAEGKVETKTSKAREVRVIGAAAPARFSFVFDHDPFGEPGVFTNSGTVEAAEGGALVMHASAVRTSGQMMSWTAQRSAISPIAGSWRLSEIDGKPAERGAPTLAVSAGPSATVRLKGQEQTVKDVTFADGVLGFTVDGKAFGVEGDSAVKVRLDGEALKGERTDADGAKHALAFKRDDRPQVGRAGGGGPRGGQAPSASEEGDQKDDDGITGTWTGTATPPAPGAPVPFTLTITKAADGALKGTITSAKGSHELTGIAYAADTGALSFTITAPSGPAQNTVTIKDGKLSGTLSVGSGTYTLSGARSAPDEDEEQPPKDIPETYGYPFGPYAMDKLPDQPAWLELRGATIWTEGPAGVIEHGTLIVKNGKIDYVGKPFTGKRPDGAVEIDLPAGTHITPGLIDCHSHTGISRGVNESGQAVTAEVRIQDVTDPDSMSWYWQLAGGLTCVNNLHGSANPIGGQNCVNKIRWGSIHADDLHFAGAMPGIKFALGENVKQSNWGTDSGRYPKTRMGVESLMRERFTAAREYLEAMKRGGTAPAHGMSATPVRRDLELETLGEILEGKRLIHCHSYRQDEILMLCRIADDFGFKLGTFQHILEGYKVADEVRDHALGASAFSDWWAYKVEVQDAIPYDGAIMHDQGVCVSFNSDSDELARRMNVEAGKACKYGGLAADEALKFVTINPARQLHIEDRVGSLEAGKDADLAVWTVLVPADAAGGRDGAATGAPSSPARSVPPLEASPLSTLAVCQATYVDGRCYFSIDQDKKLREANSAARARIVQKLLTAQNKRPEGARPDGPPGGDRPTRRRGPGDDLAAGAGPPDEPEPGGRRSLLYDTLRRAADARREYFLELIRRGIDPDTARCGECGESFLGTEVAR